MYLFQKTKSVSDKRLVKKIYITISLWDELKKIKRGGVCIYKKKIISKEIRGEIIRYVCIKYTSFNMNRGENLRGGIYINIKKSPSTAQCFYTSSFCIF